MKPITARKRRFIIQYFESAEFGKGHLARMLKVSKNTIYRVFRNYQRTGKAIAEPVKCGRKPHIFTNAETEAVVAYRQKYKACDTTLEGLLKRDGILLSHNQVYTVLKTKGLIHSLKNKRKKHDWVRFERKHSLSLWQADWKLLKNGNWIIAFKDDASRLIAASSEFKNATSEHSLEVLTQGIRQWGRPLAVLTGRDAQFYASDKKGKPSGNTRFQEFLEANDIKHVIGRVNHPQTCGKIERFFGEVERRLYTWHDFNTLEEVVHWYNYVLPNRSLNFDELETPIKAFKRKMHHKKRIITTVNEI
ncbi:MAG: DDE-type integrase/transposase/recombinase [Candidatus Micrarchaeia archaeon]|jgi:putative transposase